MTDHSPLPWAYRPYKHDDWGWIRGPIMEGEQIGELVAKAHCWASEDEKDAHRRSKTDPYAANAAFIIKAVNNHDDLVNSLHCLIEKFGGLGVSPEIVRAKEVLRAVVGGASK